MKGHPVICYLVQFSVNNEKHLIGLIICTLPYYYFQDQESLNFKATVATPVLDRPLLVDQLKITPNLSEPNRYVSIQYPERREICPLMSYYVTAV